MNTQTPRGQESLQYIDGNPGRRPCVPPPIRTLAYSLLVTSLACLLCTSLTAETSRNGSTKQIKKSNGEEQNPKISR
ncbi:unnamed protein product [Boreogadus saida]